MENKATDNEIKKALGYCTSVAYRGVCKDCVYMKFKMTDQGCLTPMLKDVLDLINRLEAENSNLTSNLTSLQNDLISAKAENERLKEFECMYNDLCK